MKEKLREVNSLDGVWGYFVCDNTGKILEKEMPVVFLKKLGTAGREITQVVGLLESLDRTSESLDLLFDDGRLLIMSPNNFTIVVFCDPNVDVATLRTKMNGVISQIQGDAKTQEIFQKGEWKRRRLLQKEYLNEEYKEILGQLVPEDVNSTT
jgi:hypothetical protein